MKSVALGMVAMAFASVGVVLAPTMPVKARSVRRQRPSVRWRARLPCCNDATWPRFKNTSNIPCVDHRSLRPPRTGRTLEVRYASADYWTARRVCCSCHTGARPTTRSALLGSSLRDGEPQQLAHTFSRAIGCPGCPSVPRSADVLPEIAFSQAFLGLRLQPLGSRGPASLWYVGGGLAAARYHTRTDLFTGVQRPSGSFKPFIELHLFGNLGSPSVDVQMGFAIPVS